MTLLDYFYLIYHYYKMILFADYILHGLNRLCFDFNVKKQKTFEHDYNNNFSYIINKIEMKMLLL